ncbi:hypothetical protein ABEB36_004811 [Hypothenemus hampei]|uniref:DUF4817 domain-containing protein n=1 Tax=Hypothenemus hampei TaxID=57062 RepID=A0ABD1EYF5_HYPHA
MVGISSSTSLSVLVVFESMANNFSLLDEEFKDMILAYGESHLNAVAAAHLYDQRFPKDIIPDVKLFYVWFSGIETLAIFGRGVWQNGGAIKSRQFVTFKEGILNVVDK